MFSAFFFSRSHIYIYARLFYVISPLFFAATFTLLAARHAEGCYAIFTPLLPFFDAAVAALRLQVI